MVSGLPFHARETALLYLSFISIIRSAPACGLAAILIRNIFLF